MSTDIVCRIRRVPRNTTHAFSSCNPGFNNTVGGIDNAVIGGNNGTIVGVDNAIVGGTSVKFVRLLPRAKLKVLRLLVGYKSNVAGGSFNVIVGGA